MADQRDLFSEAAGEPGAELFDAQPLARTARGTGSWDPNLTHRLRVLLHTGPLHDLRASDSRRDPELRHYDSLALATKVLDLIVDHAGLEREVDRRAVETALAPLLVAMDAVEGVEPDGERHAVMVDKVLGGLRNDAERRRPFELAYTDFDGDGRAIVRKLEFRLVVDHFHPAGGTVLRLSNEAVNLFLNALELDIEDAQAAAEAVVQSQLARGRFDEAVQSARNARWQSLRFQDKVVGIMRETRRDVGNVDWRKSVPRLLEDALAHIDVRLATERNILLTADERLELLSEDEGRARDLAQVARLIRDCRLRHVELHEQLMQARNVFLDEQARQAFVRAPLGPRPNLIADVLEPLLHLDRRAAVRLVEAAFPTFFGARPPPAASLAELVAWLLRPRREAPTEALPVEEPDLTTFGFDLSRYPAELRERAVALLAGLDEPTPLSTLLAGLEGDDDSPPELSELVTLLTLHDFAPDAHTEAIVSVRRVARGELQTARFTGDDLEVEALSPETAGVS